MAVMPFTGSLLMTARGVVLVNLFRPVRAFEFMAFAGNSGQTEGSNKDGK